MRVVVYRKGEITQRQIDREWPYQVALPHFWVAGENFPRVMAFCNDLSLAPRGGSIVREGVICNLYCFAKEEDAEKFRKQFSGYMFKAEWRGRGRYRNQWVDPKAGIFGRD